jgi:hypothetical protein
MNNRGASMPAVVYVAGARAELERVRKWAAAVSRSRSLELADRWFDSDEPAPGAGVLSHVQALDVLHQYRALRSARVFWLLWPTEHEHAASVSFGYALAQRFHTDQRFAIIVSGLCAARTALTSLADYRSDSDALGFDAVLALAQTRAAESAR